MTLNVYTVPDRNQLYIGTENGFIGQVQIDSNDVSRFFNKLFGYSIDVVFGEKTRTVNANSYHKLISRLTDDTIKRKDIRKYTVFSDAVNLSSVKITKPMRDAIGKVKGLQLFKKLAEAVDNNNTEKALKQAYKGAALHIPFYDRGIFGIAFTSPTDGLPSNKTYEFDVFKGAPLLHAAHKANTILVKALHALEGPNIAPRLANLQAEGYTLTKHNTTGVQTDKYAATPGASLGSSSGVELSLKAEVSTSTETHLAETITKKLFYNLNTDLALTKIEV